MWLHADQATGRASVDSEDLLSVCGKSYAGLTDCFSELEDIGARIKFVPGNTAEVEIAMLGLTQGELSCLILKDLALQCGCEGLVLLHSSAGQQPITSVTLLVFDEQDLVPVAYASGDADPQGSADAHGLTVNEYLGV